MPHILMTSRVCFGVRSGQDLSQQAAPANHPARRYALAFDWFKRLCKMTNRSVTPPTEPVSPRYLIRVICGTHVNRMNSNLLFGTTRTTVRPRHALIAPDGHVVSNLPGVTNATTVVLISPEMGAGFTELTITFAEGGHAAFPDSQIEAFIYVLQGSVTAQAKNEKKILSAGEFLFVPAVTPWLLTEPIPESQVHIFLKRYVALPGVPEPGILFGREQDIPGQPFLGDESARLQVLLPDNPSFDLAVNIFNYQAGAHLPFVETHIMEHGLLMLAGTGVYRLEDNWYPVTAGDCIWMAPYCPQWFVAMGKTPPRYLYYKDVNRLTV